MDEFLIRDIKLYGRHGCFAREQKEPTLFLVSMRMLLDLKKAALSDELSDTVDYPSAIKVAESVICGESVRLIEKLADCIAKKMLSKFEIIDSIEVKVAKCNTSFTSKVSEISALIRRSREDL
mgnify:CR=1 FL=1